MLMSTALKGHRSPLKVDKSGSGILNMWTKFAHTHRSRDTAHAQWL